MIALIRPSRIHGEFQSRPSKSMMQRACALAMMHKGVTRIQHYGQSYDDLVARRIITSCGAVIHGDGDSLTIHSTGDFTPPAVIDCGESGLSLRMFALLLSTSSASMKFIGHGTLNSRTIFPLVQLLSTLGAEVSDTDGKLPLIVGGPISLKDVAINADSSSQYLTGLLFAFVKAVHKPVRVEVNRLVSKGYAEMSVSMLQHFGYEVYHENHTIFHVLPRKKPYQDISLNIEGDWSGAAFFLVYGALQGGLTISGLDSNSLQPDSAVMEVLKSCDASFVLMDNQIIFPSGENHLKPFHVDATDCPDLFPPLVVLAACISGKSSIAGVSRLHNKESDRAFALSTELAKMGVSIFINENVMEIEGGGVISGAIINAHQDHRIAMAAAMLALMADTPSEIQGAEAVNKSFPDFFQALQMLHADVSLYEQ